MEIFKIITLDNETGGITNDVSLLTTTMQIYEIYKEQNIWNCNLIDELDLKLKPDKNAPLVIHPEALSVNKINLIKHYEEAISYSDAGKLVYEFLSKYTDHKLIPMGQNIQNDIKSLFNSKIISENTWNNFVSVKIIELMSLAQILIIKGIFPIDQSCSLSNIAKKLKIKIEKKKLHTSKYDTELNIKVFIKILNMLGTK